MSILQRLARLLRADMHATLDQWESPAAQLKQSLREMEAVLGAWEQQLSQGRRQYQRNEQQLASWQHSCEQINAQITLSLDQDRDELARPLLRRRLWLEQQRSEQAQRQQILSQELSQLQQQLEQGRQQWQLLQEQCGSWVATEEPAMAGVPAAARGEDQAQWVSDHAVELALLQERQRRAQAAAASLGGGQ